MTDPDDFRNALRVLQDPERARWLSEVIVRMQEKEYPELNAIGKDLIHQVLAMGALCYGLGYLNGMRDR